MALKYVTKTEHIEYICLVSTLLCKNNIKCLILITKINKLVQDSTKSLFHYHKTSILLARSSKPLRKRLPSPSWRTKVTECERSSGCWTGRTTLTTSSWSSNVPLPVRIWCSSSGVTAEASTRRKHGKSCGRQLTPHTCAASAECSTVTSNWRTFW